MSSGIECTKEILSQFEILKMGKKHRYLSIQIVSKVDETSKNKKSVEGLEIESMPLKQCDDLDSEGSFKELLDLLKDNKSRYVVFLWSVPNKANIKTEKLFFVQYVPDEHTSIKLKMLYTASAGNLKQALGLNTIIQLNELSDCVQETFLNRF